MNSISRHVYADGDALAMAAAVRLQELALESIAARGVFTVALSGGSTPKKLYTLLAADSAFADFPWTKTHLFFGDERHVPPDDAESNFRMTQTTLMSSGRVPEENLHRVRAELPSAATAADEYEIELRAFFTPDKHLGGFPRFDVVLLGMGPDGHTASLFPDSAGLGEEQRWVIANWVAKFKTDRITFTFPVPNAARHVLLLVAGADKAAMLHEIFVTKREENAHPVQRVVPVDGEVIWMLDRAAAAKLPASDEGAR